MSLGTDPLTVVAAATYDRVYVWEEWQHVTDTSDTESIDSGIDLYVFDPEHNSWTPDLAAAVPTDGSDQNDRRVRQRAPVGPLPAPLLCPRRDQ